MLENKEVWLRFSGNEDESKALARFACVQLMRMKDLMALGGVVNLTKTTTLPNGTTIWCQSIYGQDRVHITTPTGVTVEVPKEELKPERVIISPDECPLILFNGYLDTYSQWFDGVTAGQRANNEMREDIEDYYRIRLGQIYAGHPMMYGVRKVPAYVPPEPPVVGYPKVSVARQLPAGVSNDTKDDTFPGTFYGLKPSRYSGLMRRVLQCTLATDVWEQLSGGLSYTFSDSWGVIKTPEKDGSDGAHYHLVNIKGTSSAFVVQAEFCVHEIKDSSGTVYAPILKSVDFTKSTLLDGALGGLKGGSHHETVGWAFSYTTAQASVVLFSSKPSGNPIAWIYTQEVTLTFTYTEGVPSGFTLSAGASRNIRRNPGDLEVPVFNGLTDSMGGAVVTGTYDFTGLSDPPGKVWEGAPLHVFYKQDGTKVLSTYSARALDIKTTSIPQEVDHGYVNNSSGAWWYGFSRVYSSPAGYESSYATEYGSTFEWVSITTIGVQDDPKPMKVDVVEKMVFHRNSGVTNAGGQRGWFVGGGGFSVTTNKVYMRQIGTVTTAADNYRSVVTLVPEDREAVIYQRSMTKGSVTDALTGNFTTAVQANSENHQTMLQDNYGYWVSNAGTSWYPADITWHPGVYKYPEGPPHPKNCWLIGASSLDTYAVAINGVGNAYLVKTETFSDPFPDLNKVTPATTTYISRIVTSTGNIDVSTDPGLRGKCFGYWDPIKVWAPDFSSAAYSPSTFYERRNETTTHRVVYMNGEEYNPENFITGWIGVV